MTKRRCNKCGVTVHGAWLDGFPEGCANYVTDEDMDASDMCRQMTIELLRNALRRALSPESFDQNSRVKDGELLKVLDLENKAIQQAAALRGPISVNS